MTSCHLSFACWHLVFRFRRGSLRFRTNGKSSAQQSNEICSGTNEQLGFKALRAEGELKLKGIGSLGLSKRFVAQATCVA